MFLQSTVVPICTYRVENGRATVLDVLGTAFFIDRVGHFLTARHVTALGDAALKQGLNVGIVVKDDGGKDHNSLIAPITAVEDAPPPYDVSLGKAPYKCEVADLYLSNHQVELWHDVASYGYPLSAKGGPPENLTVNIRSLKGYIQRIIQPNELQELLGKHPAAYELSFLIGQGASGSPLFFMDQRKALVIGICVGSYRSEILEHMIKEIKDEKTIFQEKLVKIEQFGIAQIISPLLTRWRPELTGRRTLIDLQRETLP